MTGFRATVWPSEIPAVKYATSLGPYRLDGDVLTLDLEHASVRTFDVPDELYLRGLADLDTDDSTAVVDFINTYGRLGHRDPRLLQLLGIDVPVDTDNDSDEWRTKVSDFASAAIPTTPEGVDAWERPGLVEQKLFIQFGQQHIETFRAWVRAFRSLTDTYWRYSREEASELEFINFAIVLQDLLEVFTPTVRVLDASVIGVEDDPFDESYPRLENVLALQIFRHLALENTYHRCENEPCRRLFVYQQGRSEHSQHHTTGVKYCSKNCAKAQVERQRRRRIRLKDNG